MGKIMSRPLCEMLGEVAGCEKVRVHVVAFALESPAKAAWASVTVKTFKPLIKMSQAPQI